MTCNYQQRPILARLRRSCATDDIPPSDPFSDLASLNSNLASATMSSLGSLSLSDILNLALAVPTLLIALVTCLQMRTRRRAPGQSCYCPQCLSLSRSLLTCFIPDLEQQPAAANAPTNTFVARLFTMNFYHDIAVQYLIAFDPRQLLPGVMHRLLLQGRTFVLERVRTAQLALMDAASL